MNFRWRDKVRLKTTLVGYRALWNVTIQTSKTIHLVWRTFPGKFQHFAWLTSVCKNVETHLLSTCIPGPSHWALRIPVQEFHCQQPLLANVAHRTIQSRTSNPHFPPKSQSKRPKWIILSKLFVSFQFRTVCVKGDGMVTGYSAGRFWQFFPQET